MVLTDIRKTTCVGEEQKGNLAWEHKVIKHI